MSIVTMSTNLFVGSLSIEQVRYDMVESSDADGTEATRIFGFPKWRVAMSGGDILTADQSAVWASMLLSLNGRSNVLAIFDAAKPTPRGTITGALTLNADVAPGTSSMVMTGATGTLKQGDWLQIGTGVGTSQFVKVQADATASAGLITVTFRPHSRYTFTAGTAVTYDHPLLYTRLLNKSSKWSYNTGSQLENGYPIDLLETFSP
jgi:hypothetical protein